MPCGNRAVRFLGNVRVREVRFSTLFIDVDGFDGYVRDWTVRVSGGR